MIRLIKILCWFIKPDFKWLETKTKYRRAFIDDWGQHWQASPPLFCLDYGLKEDLVNSYSAVLPIKYHPRYRLETHWQILKMVFKNGLSRRIFKQGKR